MPIREKDQFFSKSQSPVEQFTGPNRTHLLEAENFLVLGNSIETSPGVHSEINIWGILCYWLAVIGSLIIAPANYAWSHWWQTRKSGLEVFSDFSAPYFLGLLRPAPYSRLRHGSRPIFSPLTPGSSSEELQATESLARNCDRRATTSNHKQQDSTIKSTHSNRSTFFVFEMPSQS